MPSLVRTNAAKFDPKAAIFTPQEAAVAAVEQIKKRKEGKTRGLRFPIPELRGYCQDMLPGQLGAVIAQTSNYKTGFLDFWAYAAAQQLQDEERFDECIIYITLEDNIEDEVYAAVGRTLGIDPKDVADGKIQDWSMLLGASAKVGAIPIYRLGTALSRPDNYQQLYWTNLMRSLDELVSGGVTGKPVQPAAIFIDYLQALPFDPEVRRASMEQQRRMQIRQDIYAMKQAAFHYVCPVIVGVQAKQTLTGALSSTFQLPGVYDGSEAQEIGQHPDRVYTLWMPKMTSPVGTRVEHGGISFQVAENMLWFKVAKQKPRLPSGRIWMLQIDFLKNNVTLHHWMRALMQRQGETVPEPEEE